MEYQGYPEGTDITYSGYPLEQMSEQHRLILETVRAKAGGYTIEELQVITGLGYTQIVQIAKDIRQVYKVAIKSVSVSLGAAGSVIHRLCFAIQHYPKWIQEMEQINYEYKIID